MYKLDGYFDSFILTGSPADGEKCREFESLLDKSRLRSTFINACGKFSLGETAYLLKEAHFIVSIDTGISHMSAAFEKPLICIQGPASSLRWRPYSQRAVVVNPDKGTFGYLSFGFEHHKAKENCMENISVDAVYSAFQELYRHNYPLVRAGSGI
jgi:ADP-heptose:LPS heptosyltransferase